MALITTPVYDSYWNFACERQNVWTKKRQGTKFPWTSDPVISAYRFTNVYRAADRVSQYLIRRVIYHGDQSPTEVFFRLLLFKIFNRISTWELLESSMGSLHWGEFSFERYSQILDGARKDHGKIYSAAYIMPSGVESFGYPEKHRNHLRLIETMMRERVPERISHATSMRQGFEVLLSYPMIGPFLAYQFITDINYSEITDFGEMDFVVAGPGAHSGVQKCFGGRPLQSAEDLIRYTADHQEEEFEARGLIFETLWGRRLQLIDCQNVFCEVDKYSRVAHPEFNRPGGRNRIKQRFKPNPEPIEYWFPPKWGINERVQNVRAPNREDPLVTTS